MKIIHKYIIKEFLKPFASTFLISLFILVMQAIWLIFDSLAGKGMTPGIMAKYVFYVSVVTVPQAIPLATLLASIMTMGNLSEKYEFAAIKSAGISLQQLLKPLIILVVFLSFINLYFLNYAFPWAVMHQKNLYKNIKEQKPALAFIEDTFNTEIPNYIIRFDKKYGPEENLLDNVLIYKTEGNKHLLAITAKKGKIITEEGSRYMKLDLEDGYFYNEHWRYSDNKEKRKRMPFSKTHFDRYTVNMDISAFSHEGIDEIRFKSGRDMLSFKQLNIYSDSLKKKYDTYIENKALSILRKVKYNKLRPLPDSSVQKQHKTTLPILDNFEPEDRHLVIDNAIELFDRTYNSIKNKQSLMNRRKRLNLIDIEFHRRIALSFSALLLFFIGAPLGSLIRKGGFGLPMVTSIFVYLVYYFLSEFSKNMAEESTITHILGGWMSTIILFPLAFYLTYRATRDRGTIQIAPLIEFFKKKFRQKDLPPHENKP